MVDGEHWDKETRRLVESPFRLRFELGGEDLSHEGQSVPRFIRAFDRARQVADAVFAESLIGAVVGCSLPQNKKLFPPEGDGFRALGDVGFDAVTSAEWRAPRYKADGACCWRYFEIGADRLQRDILLWCSVGAEMAVRPRVPLTIYLIDPARRIMMHVYDDRGMDVSAVLPNVLTPAYVAFDHWLLAYDRPRMAQVFKLGST
jgi:hypothetical protein